MSGGPRHLVDRDGLDEVHWIDDGPLTLGVVPALGGRLLALRWDGVELLHRNERLIDERLHRTAHEATLPPLDATMATWRNYGGDKTWPAPQGWDGPGQWAGPPDPVLDSGAWTPTVARDGDTLTLRMRSAPEPRTGLWLERAITVDGTSGFTLELAMGNAADHPVRWALWNVTQVRGGRDPRGALHVGVDAAHRDPVVGLLAGTGYPRYERAAADHLVVPDQDVVGKLGFPAAAGWLAYAAGGLLLCQRFPVDDDATYADRGSRAEAWLEHPLSEPLTDLGGLQPTHRVVECEALGPLTTLEPGQRTRLPIRFDVVACAEPTPSAVRDALARTRAEAA